MHYWPVQVVGGDDNVFILLSAQMHLSSFKPHAVTYHEN